MSTGTVTSSVGSGRLRRLRGRAAARPYETLLWAIASVALAVYLVVLLLKWHALLVDTLWNPDFTGLYLLAETISHVGGDHHTIVATTGDWIELWYGILTAHLPFYRELWEVTPTIVTMVAAAVIGRCVWRVAGVIRGAIAFLLVAIIPPSALAILIAPAHPTVYVTTALLGGTLPWLRRRRLRGPVAWAAIVVAIVAGAIALGVAMASDELVLVTAIIPLAALSVLALLVPARRVRLTGAGVLVAIVLAIPVEHVTNSIMKRAGYLVISPHASLVSSSQWLPHLDLLAQALQAITGGYINTDPGRLHPLLGVACIDVLVVALVVLVVGGCRALWGFTRRPSLDDAALERTFHVAYWFMSAGACAGAFIFSAATNPDVVEDYSYVLDLVLCLIATVPVLLGHGRFARLFGPAALTVLAITSIVGITYPVTPPLSTSAATIVNDARKSHATYGYAGYSDASNLTWMTHEEVKVRPVQACAAAIPSQAGVCPFFIEETASWYTARPMRTFLLVDPSDPYLTGPPVNLGKPLKTYTIGTIKMYVYSYNVAKKFG